MDDILDSLSRQGRKLKDRLKGKKHKRGGKGASTAGERGDSSGSLLRPEPRVVAGGQDGEGSRASTDVPQVLLRDQFPQPKPVPAGGNGDDNLRRREANVDEKEVSQKDSHLEPDFVMGSGPSQETEQVEPSPSAPSIPHSGKPDSM